MIFDGVNDNENDRTKRESPSAEDEESGKGAKTAINSEFPKEPDEKRSDESIKHETPEPEEAKFLKSKLKKKEHELKHLRKEFEDVKKESSELLDRYLRAVAEMDNQRKRLEREKNDFFQFALTDLIKELLAVLDNFERALKNRDQTDGKSFQEGIELISKQFQDVIRKQGVRPLAVEHGRFDPAVHQAILTEESDLVEEPQVGEVLQKGYMIGERLLRPALVKVLVPKKK